MVEKTTISLYPIFTFAKSGKIKIVGMTVNTNSSRLNIEIRTRCVMEFIPTTFTPKSTAHTLYIKGHNRLSKIQSNQNTNQSTFIHFALNSLPAPLCYSPLDLMTKAGILALRGYLPRESFDVFFAICLETNRPSSCKHNSYPLLVYS